MLRRFQATAAAVFVTVAAAAALSPGLGHIDFPNSGSAAAQSTFLTAVLWLHSFEYDEAIASFRAAERLDPSFALAYWGEALSYEQPLWYHEDVAKARAALARLGPTPAARRARAPTAREKGYLDAVEVLFGDGDRATRVRAYSEAMTRLMHAYPADDEAAVFAALAQLATIPEGQRNIQISLAAGAIAARVLEKNPNHPGAAHVVLHAYDDGEHAAMGLKAARIYAKIAPASSHARHMPSHVFLPLGMWDEAAASDESSFAASVERVRREKLSVTQEDFHSLSWLEYEYLQQGRFVKARETLEPVRRALDETRKGTPTVDSTGHHGVESEIGRGFGPLSLRSELASMRARYVIESGDWEMMKSQPSFDNIDELFALGISSVRLNDFARADAALEQLNTVARGQSNTVARGFSRADPGGLSRAEPDRDLFEIAAIMADELHGVLSLVRGAFDEGVGALRRAASLEGKRAKPIARPYPIKPAGELLGEALLALDKPQEALAQFQAALVRTPRRPAALLGAMRAAEAAGAKAEASRYAHEFLGVWHLADANRGELAEARRIVKP